MKYREIIKKTLKLIMLLNEAAEKNGEEYNVVGVVFYGSRIKGTHQPDSDIDLITITRNNNPKDVRKFLAILSEELRIKIHGKNYAKYDNEKMAGWDFLVGHKYRIVTPYSFVRKSVRRFFY